MISRILVATDGSETARKACQYAVELAKGLGAEVMALTVIETNIIGKPLIPGSAAPKGMMESVDDYLKQVAEAILADLESVCIKEGVPVKTIIRKGHPVEEIVKGAKALKADLIVVGSHGKSALETALLGSVAFGVSHKDAKIPVLIVRH